MIVLDLAPQRVLAHLAVDPLRQPVIDEILTPAPTTLMRASTLPGQITALAATQAPSSSAIGWQKKRNRGSFQS